MNDIDIPIKDILSKIGEDVEREGLKDTPKRVSKMYNEIFRGYDTKQKPNVTTFPNGQDGITYDQMIIDTGKFYSHCEHHMVPFFGEYYFAYIPREKGNILGLSKVARVVEYFSAKLQVQERLGQEIVDYLWEQLCIDGKFTPKGMMLVLKGKHLCKVMRGVKNDGEMITSTIRGAFNKPEVRQEFLELIGGIK